MNSTTSDFNVRKRYPGKVWRPIDLAMKDALSNYYRYRAALLVEKCQNQSQTTVQSEHNHQSWKVTTMLTWNLTRLLTSFSGHRLALIYTELLSSKRSLFRPRHSRIRTYQHGSTSTGCPTAPYSSRYIPTRRNTRTSRYNPLKSTFAKPSNRPYSRITPFQILN